MKQQIMIFLLGLLIMTASTTAVIAQDSNGSQLETYTIIYDEAHYQYFTHDLMQTALSSLNDSLDTEQVDVQVKLVIQTDQFNSTNLQGADLVMITNPGMENGSLPSVGSQEDTHLRNLMGLGGSVMWMSNPLSHNANITGNAGSLKDLIFSGFAADPTVGASDNATIIRDDVHFVQNNTYVRLNGNNLALDTMRNEVNNITKGSGAEFLYYGSLITETNTEGNFYGNTSGTAYVQNTELDITRFQSPGNNPLWMYGEEIDQGRALLLGSTIMFSDYDSGISGNWIDQLNNLELFQNIVGWALGVTPLPEKQNLVTQPFSYFVSTNIMMAIILSAGLGILIILTFISQERLKVSQIFDIFKKDGGSKSKKSKSSSRKETTSQSSKKSKRRKRT